MSETLSRREKMIIFAVSMPVLVLMLFASLVDTVSSAPYQAPGPATPAFDPRKPLETSRKHVSGSITTVWNDWRYSEENLEPNLITDEVIQFIDEADYTLDIFAYSFNNPYIKSAVAMAVYRGVYVRIVCETDYYDQGDYDWFEDLGIEVVCDNQTSNLMHVKAMIRDGVDVMYGTMNFTVRGASLHDNHIQMIKDEPLIADEFTQEFEQMFIDKKFSGSKDDSVPQHFVTQYGQVLSVCFSPEDDCGDFLKATLDNYCALGGTQVMFGGFFFFTHDDVADSLVCFLNDDVPIYMTMDDLGAGNQYSEDEKLCMAGALIWMDEFLNGKKTHIKFMGMMGDIDAFWTGSTNWTGAGLDYGNNEVMVHIIDSSITAFMHKIFMQNLIYLQQEGLLCA